MINLALLRILLSRADRFFGGMNLLDDAIELFADRIQVIPRVTPLS
jgi:hypothetical protein